MPMDKTSTPEFKIDASVIRQALKCEKLPKPAVTSLEFIKNFASCSNSDVIAVKTPIFICKYINLS